MARYEHLPIFRDAYDLAVHMEKIVRNFSRYHKYTLGTELRNKSRAILEIIVKANNARERAPHLFQLRQELETLKLTARLCHDSGGFSGTRGYLYVAERIKHNRLGGEAWPESESLKSFSSVPVPSLCVRPAPPSGRA